MKNKTITSYIIGTVAIIGIAAGSVAYAQGMHGQVSQGGMMGQTTQKAAQNGMHGQTTQGNMMGQTTQQAATNSMHGQATQGGAMGQMNQKGASNNMMGQTTQKTTSNSMHEQAQAAKNDIRDTMHGNSTSTKPAMANHHSSK